MLSARVGIRHLSKVNLNGTKPALWSSVRVMSSSSNTKLVVGLRNEDKNRWERRAPLTPVHVQQLSKEGIPVLVQTSRRRVFPDVAYEKAGAKIVDDLTEADIILGVKEVPSHKLLADKTYMFFSHTHKAQPYNMNMLDNILQKNIRLIDYELLTNDEGMRLVKFGTFAGYAGMIDTLHGLGQRLLGLGQSSPFVNLGMSYTYSSLNEAKRAISLIGEQIKEHGVPNDLGPMVFVFVGDGNVSLGAQEVFQSLPHKYLKAKDLKALFDSKNYDCHVIYGVMVNDDDYIRRKDGKAFERPYYRSHPQEHYSIFHDEIAPYSSVMINGIYWESKYPRLLTVEHAKNLIKSKNNRPLVIGDISCDYEGSMEMTKKFTSIEDPFYLFDSNSKLHNNIEGEGIVMMTIENLPTELPSEASQYFGNALTPLVKKLATTRDFKDYDPILSRATITEKGKFTPRYQYINDLRKKNQQIHVKDLSSKKILLLGSGMVAEPVVDNLALNNYANLTIASISESEARKLSKNNPNITPIKFDINNKSALNNLIKDHDLVISLVPAPFHPSVAEGCIENKKDMVTASYISPLMKALHNKAVAAGITILNEIGLDPGIDHLSAMKIIDEVKEHKGKVVGFSSVCGGLPAPEASDNPLGYKFSWSPRGVLSAGLNPSKFLRNGKVYSTPAGQLFNHVEDIDIGYPGFNLECLPNRDSTIYSELYGLQDSHTVFRGTLRNKGFSSLMAAFSKLGLFDESENPKLKSENSTPTWKELVGNMIGFSGKAGRQEILEKLSKKLQLDNKDQPYLLRVYSALEKLGLLSDRRVLARGKVIDSFCGLLEKELSFRENERDMVILHHDFDIVWNNGEKEKRTSTLVSYGTPGGYTAMSKTVGLPTAYAARLILDSNKATLPKGVLAPMTKEFYNPILHNLALQGITFAEKTYKVL